MSTRAHGTGKNDAQQWFGIYEGVVVNNRITDLYVQARVPQVMGSAVTAWAPPILDPRQGTPYGGQVFYPAPAPPPNDTVGGPGPGSRILVQFVGGDINSPVYSLYGI